MFSDSLAADIRSTIDEPQRHRFSYWCRQRQLDGREPPQLTTAHFEHVLAQLPDPRPSSKVDLLLASLAKLVPIPGADLEDINASSDYSLACAHDEREFSFLLGALDERLHIRRQQGIVRITQAGWERLEVLAESPVVSKHAFVAMRFLPDVLALFERVFLPAVQAAGFELIQSVNALHNERIDARIMADIKRSRFVIADVTHGSQGAYFEAGYALGLGRPVIWTCRRSNMSDMHFDTKQYNHILWDDETQFREDLVNRIIATI